MEERLEHWIGTDINYLLLHPQKAIYIVFAMASRSTSVISVKLIYAYLILETISGITIPHWRNACCFLHPHLEHLDELRHEYKVSNSNRSIIN